MLYLESFDSSGVAGPDRLTGREVQDERGAGAGAKFDEDNLGNLDTTANDAEHHALAKTGFEAGAEQNDIRNAGRLHGHHRSRLDRPGRHQPSGLQASRGYDGEQGKSGDETAEHGGDGGT
jgi:hypothetical protein